VRYPVHQALLNNIHGLGITLNPSSLVTRIAHDPRTGQLRVGPAIQMAGFDLGTAIVKTIDSVANPVIDWTKGAVGDVVDAVATLPGGDLIKQALVQADKWAIDLAKNPATSWVLVAMADSLYGPIAWGLGGPTSFGPQVASLVFGLPGLISGDDFGKSWFTQVIDRIKKVFDMYGGEAAKELIAQFGPAAEQFLNIVKDHFPDVDFDKAVGMMNMTPEQLAQELTARTGIPFRPDVAAMLLNYAKEYTKPKSAAQAVLDAARHQVEMANYDLRTGHDNRIKVWHLGKVPTGAGVISSAVPTFPATEAGANQWFAYMTAPGAPTSAAYLNAVHIQYQNRLAAGKQNDAVARSQALADAATQQYRQLQSARAVQAAQQAYQVQAQQAQARQAQQAYLTQQAQSQAFQSAQPVDIVQPTGTYSYDQPASTPLVERITHWLFGATSTFADSKNALIQAFQNPLPGTPSIAPSEQTLFWILGLVNGESGFGVGPSWTMPNDANPSPPFEGPSNNWGAVRYFKNDNLIVMHPDKGGVFKFQAYKTPLEGAQGFLHVFLKGTVPQVLANPNANPRDLAEAMYINGYYEGYHCGNDGQPSIRLGGKAPSKPCPSGTAAKYIHPTQAEADQANITDYAGMIFNQSEPIRKALNAPPGPVPTPGPAPQPDKQPSSTGSSIYPILGVLAVGLGGTYMLTRKRLGILRGSRV
jgi:hypothetical protein